jgi:RNA polymerase sigma factor (sigma-70 family)
MAQDLLKAVPDSELWAMLKAGDEAAFKALHGRHYAVLYRYGAKIYPDKEVVQDCLQEVFYQLWHRRATLADVVSVRFYLMKWIKRELVRTLQKNNITSVELDDNLNLTLDVHDLVQQEEEDQIRRTMLLTALEQLSPREREVIYMRFFLELTYDEICQALNLTYQVVMNYVSRGLKTLRANPLLNKLVVLLALPLLNFFTSHWLVGPLQLPL